MLVGDDDNDIPSLHHHSPESPGTLHRLSSPPHQTSGSLSVSSAQRLCQQCTASLSAAHSGLCQQRTAPLSAVHSVSVSSAQRHALRCALCRQCLLLLPVVCIAACAACLSLFDASLSVSVCIDLHFSSRAFIHRVVTTAPAACDNNVFRAAVLLKRAAMRNNDDVVSDAMRSEACRHATIEAVAIQ